MPLLNDRAASLLILLSGFSVWNNVAKTKEGLYSIFTLSQQRETFTVLCDRLIV